jgi:hypothetical protein
VGPEGVSLVGLADVVGESGRARNGKGKAKREGGTIL